MHFFHPVFSRAEDLTTAPLPNIFSVPFISKYLTDLYNETELREIALDLLLIWQFASYVPASVFCPSDLSIFSYQVY